MTIGTGARHSVGYIPEVTYNTTPSTPAFQLLRHTGFTGGMSKNTFESAELGGRQIKQFRHGNKSVGFDVPFELSYTTFDVLLEALMGGTWTTNVLKAGDTRRSFTMERLFGNLDTPEYWRYTGAEFDKLTLSVKPDAIVTGTFSVVAKDQSIGTAILTGATYVAETTTLPLDAFTGTINEGGATIGVITGLEMSLVNGLSPMFVLGSDTTIRPGIGKSRVTGTVTAYFESKTLLEKFINETASSFDFTLTDGTSSIKFDMPNIKYTGGTPDVDGEGEVTVNLPFTALYDATDASQLVITRTP